MDSCPVCLEDLNTKITVNIPCIEQKSHVLCIRCFVHLHHRECPLCRKNFEHLLPNIEAQTRMNLIEFLRLADNVKTLLRVATNP